MTREHRLAVIADATFKLLMVNPSIIVEYAYKVVANPSAYSPDVLLLAQAVVDEDRSLGIGDGADNPHKAYFELQPIIQESLNEPQQPKTSIEIHRPARRQR